ncbi:hypothetical protein DN062_07510 [Nitrincola tibetensis]|uniref:GGDEF domain-containing protein n=1 Tax=Nitrincola tibetensis TaxID=2219697 RepID=A0A364NNC0_9GAMM|nr:diguanylate cyclase [Nitrincola tibetensis]RAU18608.1 hypothetical protein DN062_07510 [Nitrincola tibetensis]
MITDPTQKQFCKGASSFVLVLLAVIILLVGIANYSILVWSQARIIEHEATRVAEVVTSHALSARSVYAGQLSEAPGHFSELPIPSEFLKLVARDVSANNLASYRYTPLSLWNLDSNQGLSDDFHYWAWAQLEAQDQPSPTVPIDWQPVKRFERINGVKTLRYMVADAANSENCVSCHNTYEQRKDIIDRRVGAGVDPGKQWQQYQLMGALEIQVSVDKIEALASSQSKLTLLLVLIASAGGVLLVGLIIWRDLQKEKKTSAFFEQEARFDPLTRLLNRSGMERSAEAALEKSHAMGAGLSVLFIDLDGFKPVNDTYGHEVGDELLIIIAARLKEIVRESDIVARMGGDEFLILLEESSESEHCHEVASQLISLLSQPIIIREHQVTVSASIGISRSPENGHGLSELIRKADQAMYEAKSKGRANYVCYTEAV